VKKKKKISKNYSVPDMAHTRLIKNKKGGVKQRGRRREEEGKERRWVKKSEGDYGGY
jgi:hypothetical protein